MRGTPWEPIPGFGDREVKSSIVIREEPIEDMPRVEKKEVARRRVQIGMQDVLRAGATPGCPGCRSALRGGESRNHTEECRARIEADMVSKGHEGVVKAWEFL